MDIRIEGNQMYLGWPKVVAAGTPVDFFADSMHEAIVLRPIVLRSREILRAAIPLDKYDAKARNYIILRNSFLRKGSAWCLAPMSKTAVTYDAHGRRYLSNVELFGTGRAAGLKAVVYQSTGSVSTKVPDTMKLTLTEE